MKKVIIILFIFQLSVAQKTIKINYEQKINYTDAFFNQLPESDRESFRESLSKPVFFELINNGDQSLFKSTNDKEMNFPSKEVNTKTSINKGTIIKPFKVWILKDNIKKNGIIKNEVGGEEYYIQKPFLKENIILDGRIKNIDSYICRSAFTVTAEKDTIQYWYTQDIPIIDGPFLTNSIPGLVLSVESKKKVVYATKIEFFNNKIEFEKVNPQTPIISEDELIQKQREALKPKSYIDANEGKHTTNSVHIKN